MRSWSRTLRVKRFGVGIFYPIPTPDVQLFSREHYFLGMKTKKSMIDSKLRPFFSHPNHKQIVFCIMLLSLLGSRSQESESESLKF